MINKRHQKPFTVLKRAETLPDDGGSSRVIYIPQEPSQGVVTRVNTGDTQGANSNVLSRQKRIRVFHSIEVNYNDRILLDGEEWEIVGEPETYHATSGKHKHSTVINIEKAGKK